MTAKSHKLLELFTQSKVGDTDSAGDAEEYERESETVVLARALFSLLAMLFWLHMVRVCFE